MKIFFSIFFVSLGVIGWHFVQPPHRDSRDTFSDTPQLSAWLEIAGSRQPLSSRSGVSVRTALEEAGYTVRDSDILTPLPHEPLRSGTIIRWQPSRRVVIVADGRETDIVTAAPTAEDVIDAAGLTLDDDDLVVPSRAVAVPEGVKIVVTRVEVREEVKETKIPYVTEETEDAKLSWRQRIVRQKGEAGIRRITYRVSYHNNKEVSRRTLSSETVKEPVKEVVTQGTQVKTGKSHRGAASWYAWTGTMAAANPWLPKGSYVRVTNLANGKSVIVVINDRGPFVPGRIIDLDKVAFEKIASLGAGVIDVKMEEITN
jgi:rare lipoprotein A (peptidoglycan hydrolase)